MINKQSFLSETIKDESKVFNLKQELMTIQETGAKIMCDTSNVLDILADDNVRNNIHASCNNDVNIETEEVQNISTNKPDSNDVFMYTNEMRVENSLLKLITDMNAPNYAFKKIMV